MTDNEKTVTQCRSCPWRVDCVPDRDIPNYVPKLHEGLIKTIATEPLDTLFCRERHVMACHYSKPGEEFPCAGWLANQIGVGNNIGARLMVMTGKWPSPVVDGPQHETFEETLCSAPGPSETRTALSTRSPATGPSDRGKRSAASNPRTTNRKTKRQRA